jgi:bifunctional DNase/RNase
MGDLPTHVPLADAIRVAVTVLIPVLCPKVVVHHQESQERQQKVFHAYITRVDGHRFNVRILSL